MRTYHLVPCQDIYDAIHILDRLFQPFHYSFADEELDKRLLIHVAPTDDSVIRL